MSGPDRCSERRWLAGLAAFLVPLAVYLVTLADGVYWEDSALLTAASLSLGIAHSPGHPLYVLLGRAMSLLGLASPTQLVNGVSAVARISSRTGLSMTRARLFPCFVSFLTMFGALQRTPIVLTV